MESLIQQPTPATAKSSTSFNVKDFILKFLRKWYWFVLSLLVFGTLAYLYMRYTIPTFSVSTLIQITEDENVSSSELAAFKDLGLLDKTKSKVESEIQVLTSRPIIEEVVDKLQLHIQYFTEGKILEVENYPKSIVEINFLAHDSILRKSTKEFLLRIDSPTAFSFLDEEGKVKESHTMGSTIQTSVGNIVIIPTRKLDSYLNRIIKITLKPKDEVVRYYRGKIYAAPLKPNSNSVQINITDPVPEKASDILNTMVSAYNRVTILNKKQLSDKTATFIATRLSEISGDLSTVDNSAASFKSNYGLTTDILAQTERFAEGNSETSRQIAGLQTQLNLIASMSQFIQSQQDSYALIPAASQGVSDNSVVETIGRYNNLVLKRNQLLENASPQNPIIINLNQQLNGLKQTMVTSLNSLRNSINIQLSNLRDQNKFFSGKVYVAPKQQKTLKDIERQIAIKEQIYLYLLQKREEAEIASSVILPNARIIDPATPENVTLISPKRNIVFGGSLLLGFVLPFMFIYLTDLFNTKIESRKTVENAVSVPIIGDIPLVKDKEAKNLVVTKSSRSSAAEAFRILRANLDFMLAQQEKDKGITLFVTSTVEGEGKTFVSSNLASALALANKKVALIGVDLRAPRIHDFFDLPKGIDSPGVTNFILNKELTPEKIIYTVTAGETQLDIIPSGIIPPNPSELLMNTRVKDLFEYLQQSYDYIVVDTSPVNLVADTLLLAPYADQCLYVVKVNHLDQDKLSVPQQLYVEKRLPNMAILINGIEATKGYGYGYGK